MKNLNKFYINGDWVTPISTDTFPVTNPANEEIVGTIAMGNQEDVNIDIYDKFKKKIIATNKARKV